MPKVLVVEDDLRIVALIRQHLQLEGFGVMEASEAKEAWQLILEERPDAALVDLALRTERDGWNLVTTVRDDGRFARMPVVVMTGSAGPEASERAEAMGCGFLAKPFEPPELMEALREQMKRALRAARVSLVVGGLRVEGTVHLPGGRFSDGWEALMREDRTFLPITDAAIAGEDDKIPFLEVRKTDILAVHPLGDQE
jgi:two-component system, chemotaxis family, chemotaxis protein CheY